MARTDVAIQHHDTDPQLYAALVQVFGERQHENTRWVALKVDGVALSFFAPRETIKVQA